MLGQLSNQAEMIVFIKGFFILYDIGMFDFGKQINLVQTIASLVGIEMYQTHFFQSIHFIVYFPPNLEHLGERSFSNQS